MKLKVNKQQRYEKMRAHTGVHLLFWALEKITWRTDIKQAGSYVDEDYWRLDFNADKPLNWETLQKIETLVNSWIKEAIDVDIFETSLDDAIKNGAKAFFDEKYWDKVRVIKIPGADVELCGWTHSQNTSFLWAFKIISQDAVSSWIKRISIITWPKVAQHSIEQEHYINQIAQYLGAWPAQILEKIWKNQKELETVKNQLNKIKEWLINSKLKSLEKQDWDFEYIIKLEDFDGIDFKTLVQKVRTTFTDSNIIIYSQEGNFAIVGNNISAKEFAKDKWLKWWGSDTIVQWRDKNILELV